jgi:hypothetical protein
MHDRHHHRPPFHGNWWGRHANCGWWGRHRPGNWWRLATWGAVTGWWAGGWGEPVYYDYGDNLYYDDGAVYYNDQQIATEDEYAQQAIDLAAAGEDQQPQNIEGSNADDWMSLGVFALSTGKDAEAVMMVQLAVSKDGVIAGTYTNTTTDKALPLHGTVDKKTQRAAWSIGDAGDPVMETGIYNLTKDETPVLVHFGKQKHQEWLMVRLEPPKENGAAAGK